MTVVMMLQLVTHCLCSSRNRTIRVTRSLGYAKRAGAAHQAASPSSRAERVCPKAAKGSLRKHCLQNGDHHDDLRRLKAAPARAQQESCELLLRPLAKHSIVEYNQAPAFTSTRVLVINLPDCERGWLISITMLVAPPELDGAKV